MSPGLFSNYRLTPDRHHHQHQHQRRNNDIEILLTLTPNGPEVAVFSVLFKHSPLPSMKPVISNTAATPHHHYHSQQHSNTPAATPATPDTEAITTTTAAGKPPKGTDHRTTDALTLQPLSTPVVRILTDRSHNLEVFNILEAYEDTDSLIFFQVTGNEQRL